MTSVDRVETTAMPEALRCPGCGSGLPADAPEGLCPACVLKGAIQVGRAFGDDSGTDPGEVRDTTTSHSPGAAFVPPSLDEIAPHFPHLEILERLGQGGMGVVYKARQIRLDRVVALKVLPPELGRDPAFAERFAREARALARLTHPRIVGVHDFGQAGGLFYLIMEYVDGANLRGLLRRGRLRPDEALRIVPQVCEALQYAHEEGVVHRDIKPENILVDRRGNVKIADFGLAKLLGTLTTDSILTGSRQVIGTLRYMAPEQMDTPLAVDHRADIYSLGVVFYEMLTGELPVGRFAAPSTRALVDERLDSVVFRALEKEPRRRYQRASEVKADVEAVSERPDYSARQPVPGPTNPGGRSHAEPVRRRESWLWMAILCAAFVAFLSNYTGEDAEKRLAGYPMVWPLIVLGAGAGLWALWRFIHGERGPEIDRSASGLGFGATTVFPWWRASLIGALIVGFLITVPACLGLIMARMIGTATAMAIGYWTILLHAWSVLFPQSDEDHSVPAARRWIPWTWVVLIGLTYTSSFFFLMVPATYGQQSLFGYQVYWMAVMLGKPFWLAHPLVWVGSLALILRRYRWAGCAGLCALVLSDPSDLTGDLRGNYYEEPMLLGHWLWQASMALLAIGGFHGWWMTGRGRRAIAVAKPVFSEIDPPRLRLDQDLDSR